MKTGYIHIYKGKNWKTLNTAFGMAARACGAGFSVCLCNFGDSHVDGIAQRLPNFHIQGIENTAQHDMVILYDCDFFGSDALKDFLAQKPQHQEIVFCGAAFDEEVLAMADLISNAEAL